MLGTREAADAIALAKKQDALELKWRRIMKQHIEESTRRIIDHAQTSGRLNFGFIDFELLVMRHSYHVMQEGIRSAVRRPQVRGQQLAGVPESKIPRSLRALREWWDRYGKTGKVPARQKSIAERLKKAYVQKLQSVWEKWGEDFREGETASKSKAIKKVMEGADVAASRGQMIVNTETTYYYNKARREVYDTSDDITHYIFMPIRDHATTKWCRSRRNLIYEKDDPILNRETPPIHWNCRSELLPLTPLNPVHKKLIDNKSKWRRNNACEPLPPGWTGR